MDLKEQIVKNILDAIDYYAKRCATFNDSLPIADRNTAWDGAGATQRMEHLATSSSTGKINFVAFSKGFLWWDSNNPELVGSYKLPFCDVMSGTLHVIPKALIAVMGRLDQTNIPEADREKIESVVEKYYKKCGMEFPTDTDKP